MRTRILLVDDHDMVRAGLRGIFEHESDIEIIGEAADGRTAVKLARELSPDLIIMEPLLPVLSGIEATRQIRAAGGSARVLILSNRNSRELIEEALHAGACGYLLGDSNRAELLLAVKAAKRGRLYLSPRVIELVLRRYMTKPLPSLAPQLSRREREVLRLVADGRTSRQISATLDIRLKTVEAHRSQLMAKLRLSSVAELTKYAIREGLTSSEP